MTTTSSSLTDLNSDVSAAAPKSRIDRKTVAEARVMVVGCGALGNEALKNLALLGAGSVTLVDFDRVERDNLCKSVLFTSEDAQSGRLKTEAASDGVARLNPEVGVSVVTGDAVYDVGLGLWSEMDVVIGCVDSRWARYGINRNCMRVGVPWVDGGIGLLEGSVRVFVPGENCYACNLAGEGLDELRRRMSCPGIVRRNEGLGKVATTAVSASVIGAVQVQEALKLLHARRGESGDFTSLCGRMFSYEGAHLTTKTVEFKAWDDDCPCHDRWIPDAVESGISVSCTIKDTLDFFRRKTGDSTLSLLLRDDCFVDFIEARDGGMKTKVLLPGRKTASFVENNDYLCKLKDCDLYQNEWRRIGGDFPYGQLTLSQLGIPERDILHFEGRIGDYFVEMG